jgi:hypothetical protein
MSFENALSAAATLATEYTSLGKRISAMATAADHDPRWSDADEHALGRAYARRDEVGQAISAAIAVPLGPKVKTWGGTTQTSSATRETLQSQAPRHPPQ